MFYSIKINFQMKKLFSIIPIFFSLFVQAQTLKTSIDNTILEQGNRGITAIKLRNNLHLIVDSLRLKTQLPVNNNTVRSYLVEDYGITGGNRNGQPPIITRIKSWITASQLLTDLNAKPTIGYFQNVDTMNPNFYSGFDYVYSTSEKLLYKFVAGSGFLGDRIDQISENIITESGAIDKLLQKQLNSKQATLSGTGFVKATSGTISYDNSTYLSTSTAASTYAPLSSPSFSGTVSGISKSMVGLGSVDNTSDAGKPVSTATQTALDAKQATLSGTGFVKATSGTISYDNSTYLTTSTAASTYLPIDNPTATGTLTAPTIANTLGANFATTSGNVGIGTTSPQNLLHVKGTAAVGVGVRNSHLTIESAETAGVDVGAVLKFAGQSGNTVNTYSFGTIEGKKESALTNNYSSYLAFHTIDNIGGSNERMRINGNGNIGVGISSTTFKLHVNGGNIYVGGAGAGVRIEDRSLSSRSYQLYVDGGAFAFFNHNNSTQPVTITDGGNFGIGTTAPSYKLDVNGTARVTGTTQLNGNVGIGAAPSTQSLNVFSNTNDIAFQAINVKTTGSNYAVAGTATGVGGTLNMGGFFYADGAATNHGIRVFNVTAAANNYALFIDSPAKSYFQGSVGIGTTSPATSSILDITSTTKGVLFPRLTTTEINAISSPADGLTVYNTTLKAICFYDSSAAVWKKVSHSNM